MILMKCSFLRKKREAGNIEKSWCFVIHFGSGEYGSFRFLDVGIYLTKTIFQILSKFGIKKYWNKFHVKMSELSN